MSVNISSPQISRIDSFKIAATATVIGAVTALTIFTSDSFGFREKFQPTGSRDKVKISESITVKNPLSSLNVSDKARLVESTTVETTAPTIQYVNSTQQQGSGVSYIDFPALNCTGGNTIIVLSTNYISGGAPISGITDTALNTYVEAGTTEGEDANHSFETWVATGITGNANNVIRVTYSASTDYIDALALQYSGLATSDVYDVSATFLKDPSQVTSHTSNSTSTTTVENELVLMWCSTADAATGTFSASSPYVVRESITNACAAIERIVSSTGSYNGQVTTQNACKLDMQVRTFKAPVAVSRNVNVHDHFREVDYPLAKNPLCSISKLDKFNVREAVPQFPVNFSLHEHFGLIDITTEKVPYLPASALDKFKISENVIKSESSPQFNVYDKFTVKDVFFPIPVNFAVADRLTVKDITSLQSFLSNISVSDHLKIIDIAYRAAKLYISFSDQYRVSEISSLLTKIGDILVSDSIRIKDIPTLATYLSGISLSDHFTVKDVLINIAIALVECNINTSDHFKVSEVANLISYIGAISKSDHLTIKDISSLLPLSIGISVFDKIGSSDTPTEKSFLGPASAEDDLTIKDIVTSRLSPCYIIALDKQRIREQVTQLTSSLKISHSDLLKITEYIAKQENPLLLFSFDDLTVRENYIESVLGAFEINRYDRMLLREKIHDILIDRLTLRELINVVRAGISATVYDKFTLKELRTLFLSFLQSSRFDKFSLRDSTIVSVPGLGRNVTAHDKFTLREKFGKGYFDRFTLKELVSVIRGGLTVSVYDRFKLAESIIAAMVGGLSISHYDQWLFRDGFLPPYVDKLTLKDVANIFIPTLTPSHSDKFTLKDIRNITTLTLFSTLYNRFGVKDTLSVYIPKPGDISITDKFKLTSTQSAAYLGDITVSDKFALSDRFKVGSLTDKMWLTELVNMYVQALYGITVSDKMGIKDASSLVKSPISTSYDKFGFRDKLGDRLTDKFFFTDNANTIVPTLPWEGASIFEKYKVREYCVISVSGLQVTSVKDVFTLKEAASYVIPILMLGKQDSFTLREYPLLYSGDRPIGEIERLTFRELPTIRRSGLTHYDRLKLREYISAITCTPSDSFWIEKITDMLFWSERMVDFFSWLEEILGFTFWKERKL